MLKHKGYFSIRMDKLTNRTSKLFMHPYDNLSLASKKDMKSIAAKRHENNIDVSLIDASLKTQRK